jgi:acyl-CoA hydrolase
MVSDELVALAEAGALDPAGHLAGIAIGSPALYAWLARAESLAFVPTPQTHGALALGRRERFVAINSALEVDLLGQANLEWRDGRLVSGVGGAPDFIAGARLSPGGLSVVALPATAKGRSRIVPRIEAPSVSIPRNMIDVVVTEHGAAHIRDLPMEARAQALIGVAAPEHRAALQAGWERLRDGF